MSQQASDRTRIAQLRAKLLQREHFLYEQHSLLIDEPEDVHIDRNTIVDVDGLNVTLFTVVSPQPHRLKIKVDENFYLVESYAEVVGNVSRMTVVIDQLDDKVKTSIHCGRHDFAVLDKIDFQRAMQSYLYPPLTGSSGISNSPRPDRPIKLFRWLGAQYLQVDAIFTD